MISIEIIIKAEEPEREKETKPKPNNLNFQKRNPQKSSSTKQNRGKN